MYLFRRWWLFWAISFCVCAAVAELAACVRKRKTVNFTLSRLAITAAAIVAPLIALRAKVVTDYMSGSSYKTLYSAYSNRGTLTDFSYLVQHYGYLILLASLASTIYFAVKKKRYTPVFLWLHGIITFFVFRMVQANHGQQHYLLYAPMVYIPLLCGVSELFGAVRSHADARSAQQTKFRLTARTRRAAVIVVVIVFAAFVQLRPYVTAPLYARTTAPTAFTALSYVPNTRDDLSELLRLARDIDALPRGDKRVGIVASSTQFSADQLRLVEYSLNVPMASVRIRDYFAEWSHIDSRDAMPLYLYDCAYIVVANPVQTHIAPENQTVVTAPYTALMSGTTLGAAFIRLPNEYKLTNGITVYIFQKNRELTDEEKAAFENLMPNVRRS
jgi:hypothetical protein